MIPENCYVKQQELEPFPSGIRIDYVLFKVRPQVWRCTQHVWANPSTH